MASSQYRIVKSETDSYRYVVEIKVFFFFWMNSHRINENNISFESVIDAKDFIDRQLKAEKVRRCWDIDNNKIKQEAKKFTPIYYP